MEIIDAKNIDFQDLNKIIKEKTEVEIINCDGQRFIGSGTIDKKIVVKGVPGNALGAYMSGSTVSVFGNAQDAVGDTMNDGKIIVHGNCGDAVGYAMRGGKIFIKGKAGYRVGIHIKEYKDKKPVIIIGENAGSFLGEYQAGGLIVVLNLKGEEAVGDFCGTGMHGGKIFLRTDNPPKDLPKQVNLFKATKTDLEEIKDYLDEYCQDFGLKLSDVILGTFYVLTPNSANPYKQLYVRN
ncbi:MAG: glutamate synthase [Clostridia bacterium]|nr:glutamate synthase [Clostridia bacterium]